MQSLGSDVQARPGVRGVRFAVRVPGSNPPSRTFWSSFLRLGALSILKRKGTDRSILFLVRLNLLAGRVFGIGGANCTFGVFRSLFSLSLFLIINFDEAY